MCLDEVGWDLSGDSGSDDTEEENLKEDVW